MRGERLFVLVSVLVPAGALTLVAGCTGARTSVVADSARVPISLSRGVRDADGELVASARAHKVATFRDTGDAFGFFYSLATVSAKKDISQEINRQVAAHGGDAVINLEVRSLACGIDFVPVLSWLPLWPGCTHLEIVGDIVKVTPKSPPAIFSAPKLAPPATPTSEPPSPLPAVGQRTASVEVQP